MQITTNNVPRDLIDGWDLTEKERKEFDYIGTDEKAWFTGGVGHRFFRYKGNLYDTQDCEQVTYVADTFRGWDGYYSQTFFSGVVFKYAPDTDYEQVIVGRYST